MSDPHPPLDPDLTEMIDRARSLDSVPTEVSARMLESLASRVGPPAPRWPSLRSASRPLVLLATFVAGAGAGVALRRPAPPVERIVFVDRPAASTSVSAPATPIEVPTAPLDEPTPSAEPPSHTNGKRTAPSFESSGEQLPAESKLLGTARTAIARGEGDHALAAIERHAAQFPRGALSEEREALAVQALHLLGRDDDARARAERFAATYPRSLFLPIVKQTVAGQP